MSESHESGPSGETPDGTAFDAEAEVIDGFPVLAGAPRIIAGRSDAVAVSDQRRGPLVLPAVQAAAVAAGGFLAGAAVLGLVHRRERRSMALSKGRRARRELANRSRLTNRAGEIVQIVGSRSFLVDVHLLGGSGGDR